MSWIKVVDEDNAMEELHRIYDKIKANRGKISNIMRIHSLHPETMEKHLELYDSLMFGKSNLSREEREFIGVVVSTINKCEYCINHHAEALNYYWKDRDKINRFMRDFRSVELSERQLEILNYITKLTDKPKTIVKEDIEKLRTAGFSDRDILDINLIASYFNFVNRIALGLGVKFSEDELKGYNY